MTVGILVLALSLPVAVFVLWPLRRRTDDGVLAAGDPEPAELETEKLAALRTLRELALDHEAGHLAEDDYADLRARAEARAAVILRRLDAMGTARRPLTAAPAGPVPGTARSTAARIPWTRRPAVLALTALGILVFGVVLGVLVNRFLMPEGPMAGPPGAMPGMPPVTGAAPGGLASGGSPRPLPPELLQGMLQAAHASLDAGRYQEAIAAYKAVLARHPDNVDAITHLGVILAQAGHADGAIEAFDRALAIDPDYAHALWDKAGVLFDQKQDYAGAITAWERFVAVAPAGPDRDQALARMQDARQRLAAGAPAPAAATPAARAPGPRPATPAAPAKP